MRTPGAVTLALLLFASASRLSAGPRPQFQITITGPALAKPVEITDEDMLVRFFFGSGPGNHSSDGRDYAAQPSFIVDWPRGTTVEPAKELPRYEVEFQTDRAGMSAYRVTYVYDAGTGQGFVYLPGKTDPRYAGNAGLIVRGIEGNWFHAWNAWDAAVKPWLAGARN